ncbi:uncharacterized protein BDR25DRAFT_384625 [Lindgomyces ingoldianus]|uniref:Uncharacterized protein n=1 Tax=Lindgomyces ingoldianus TaxID=673940 RepID=A0ACB6Q8S9_9PLEO|nr:uncharacterized protein BDR25DRAFT_384625 [Lindgomyces ingoldianus]KAF2463306.1 hypothetical protein BDR25DRAFT_384625 [Lindgomyces ingoldianus]
MSSSRDRFSCVIASLMAISSIISWTLFVNHLVKTAHVSQGADYWVDLARHQTYSLCYNGCNDCLDVDRIEGACLMTRKVNIPGVDCDASKIWTWADRYPLECLVAVGNIYKDKALWWKKFWLGTLWLLNTLSVVVYKVVYAILDPILDKAQYRPVQRPRRNSSTPLLTAFTVSILAVTMLPSVSAYRCTQMSPAYDQHFINADGSLYGVIHGWLSNCYDESYSCGESCSTAISDGRKSCDPIWCSLPRLDKPTSYYVDSAAHRVMSCGFQLTKTIPGLVDKRIANPRIEGKLWVKVSVNHFNGSDGVFEQVQCLYEMVEPP